MALFEMNYFSKALKQHVFVTVILPEEKKASPGVGMPEAESYKTLYLFHGRDGNHTEWMRKTSIERYASDYGIAVVMPEVGRSWYTDTCYGAKYFTFVTEELPSVCRGYFKGMSARREDNFVGGLSMGGYGAVKAALNCPEKYFACISLSGSLDITRKGRELNLDEWRAFFDFNMKDGLELEGTPHDLYHLARVKKEEGIEFPDFYFWCGTEDVLVRVNREYRDLFTELGVKYLYEESEGNHTWKWWDMHIQDALNYILREQD